MSQVAYTKAMEADLLREAEGALVNKWLSGDLSDYGEAVFEMFCARKAIAVEI